MARSWGCTVRAMQEPFEIRADVVVGADGRYSALRRLGQFEIEYQHHDFDIIWFVIEQPPRLAQYYLRLVGVRRARSHAPEISAPYSGGICTPDGRMVALAGGWYCGSACYVRRFDPVFAEFAAGLQDFKPFFPLEGQIVLVKDWARDGMVLTMQPTP